MFKATSHTDADPAAVATRVRLLNDQLRRTFIGGRVVITSGVAALPAAVQREVFAAIRTFDAFSEDNDPWNEHDMAGVTVCGRRFFWKIDYYDHSLLYGSEDPADPSVTTRVLTIMLVEEY